jgi:hypothetical protein
MEAESRFNFDVTIFLVVVLLFLFSFHIIHHNGRLFLKRLDHGADGGVGAAVVVSRRVVLRRPVVLYLS